MSAGRGLLLTVGDDGGHRGQGKALGSALDWTLTISGAVARPCTLSLSQLWALPATTQTLDITCVSSGKIYRPKGQKATFAGVSLGTLLEHVGLQRQSDGAPVAKSVRLVSRAPGGCGPLAEVHETALSLDTCLAETGNLLLAGVLDELPLRYANGGPLRAVVPGYFFYKSLKWLSHIELSTAPLESLKGTWERHAGYHNVGLVEGERFAPFLHCSQGDVSQSDVSHDCDAHDPSQPRPLTHYSADDGPDAIASMRRLFLQRLEAGDISSLTIARLQEFVPDFASQPGWGPALRWHCSTNNGVEAAALRGTRFNKLDMRGWVLTEVNFSLASFIGTQLANPDGSEAADMSRCDFEGATFWGAQLQGVDMRGAYLGGVSFVKESGSGAASVEGLALDGARGLDEATAQWLTERGAVGAMATTAAARAESGGYMPCHALTIACRPSHVRPFLQALQEHLPAEAPACAALQGQPAILSGQVPHSSMLQAWLPAHHRAHLQETLLPALSRIATSATPPSIAVSADITWIWTPYPTSHTTT